MLLHSFYDGFIDIWKLHFVLTLRFYPFIVEMKTSVAPLWIKACQQYVSTFLLESKGIYSKRTKSYWESPISM